MIVNDEAHQCYRRKPGGEEVRLGREDRQEPERREEAARVWSSGLGAVRGRIAVKVTNHYGDEVLRVYPCG